MTALDLGTIPRLHDPDVVVRWGDRVLPEAVAFRPDLLTAKAAAGQVGHEVEVIGTLGLSSRKALLVAAHAHAPGGLDLPRQIDEKEALKISMAAHGLSVVGLRRSRRTGEWRVAEPARAPQNRRVHGATVCKLTGPAAGDRRFRTASDPTGRVVRGTFGHTVGTVTPWGAVLSGEGSFMDYFERSGPVERALESSFARYAVGAGRGWAAVDPRFDVTLHPAEAFRFGWVVALDPRRPTTRPRKLTMLGRLAHQRLDASLTDDGRALIRLRDGLPGGRDYVYVSRETVEHGTGLLALQHNRRLLAHGTLAVVLPGAAGRGRDEASWVPLVADGESYVPGMSAASVLMDTRLAAQRLLGSG